MKNNTIVSSLCWVSRGYAKPVLQEYEPTEEEMKEQQKFTKQMLNGKDISKTEISAAAQEIQQNLDKMEIDEDMLGEEVPIFSAELGDLHQKEVKKIKQMQGKLDKDQDMVQEDDGDEEFEDMDGKNDDLPSQFSDSEEDGEDFTIRKTDSLIVAATAENDHSSLEVYLYDHKGGDLFVHHEILLGAYPLCLEWLSQWQK